MCCSDITVANQLAIILIVFVDSLAFESLSTTRQKGNKELDKETAEYEKRKRVVKDCIRQTIAKMERAQQVTSQLT